MIESRDSKLSPLLQQSIDPNISDKEEAQEPPPLLSPLLQEGEQDHKQEKTINSLNALIIPISSNLFFDDLSQKEKRQSDEEEALSDTEQNTATIPDNFITFGLQILQYLKCTNQDNNNNIDLGTGYLPLPVILVTYGSAIALVIKGGDPDPFCSIWKSCLFFGVWFHTSVWFYRLAKVVERDLKNLDYIAQSNEKGQSDEEVVLSETEQSRTTIPDNFMNFALQILQNKNICGKVSRYIDNAWLSSSTNTTATAPTVSSLVNVAYIFWSLFLTASFYTGTNVVLTISDDFATYPELCAMYPDLNRVVPLGCTVWLIFRKGIPSGITPLVFNSTLLLSDIRYDSNIVLMTIVAIVLHTIIRCDGASRTCTLQSWINREMCIWSLYSYLTAILCLNFDSFERHIIPLLYISLTGIILEHPLLILGGYIIIFTIICQMFACLFGFTHDDIGYIILRLFFWGSGLFGLSGFISKVCRNAYLLACRRDLHRCAFGRQRNH